MQICLFLCRKSPVADLSFFAHFFFILQNHIFKECVRAFLGQDSYFMALTPGTVYADTPGTTHGNTRYNQV